MRQVIAMAVLLFGCGLGLGQEAPLAVGTQAPDFALPDLQGGYVKLNRG